MRLVGLLVVVIIRQTSPSAITIAALALAMPTTTVPKMRATNVPDHMAYTTCRLLALANESRSRTQCRALTTVPHNSRSAVHMSVEWIAEVL